MREVWGFFMVVSLFWLGKLLLIWLEQPNAPTLRNSSFIAPKVSHFVPLKVKNHLGGSPFPDSSKCRGWSGCGMLRLFDPIVILRILVAGFTHFCATASVSTAAHVWVQGESGRGENISRNGWYQIVRGEGLSGGDFDGCKRSWSKSDFF